ncbi:MAG TPA: FISUMP domain-containing protein [Fibrobacteraceae bacterium]|nr:FISUMP domain-containing protein [Fibrobacteraceae bacterium]
MKFRFSVLILLLAFLLQSCDSSSDSSDDSSSSSAASSSSGFNFETGTFTDSRDGQIYGYVVVEERTWMTQNLNYGTMIPGDSAQENDNAVEKYCYNDDSSNCANYGALYQWAEALALSATCDTSDCSSSASSSEHQGICPDGWHIPLSAEWDTLAERLGGEEVAGMTMKLDNTSNSSWNSSANNDGNTSGFSAYPLGMRDEYGDFSSFGSYAYFWTLYEGNEVYAQGRYLRNGIAYLRSENFNKQNGFAIRCVQDTI